MEKLLDNPIRLPAIKKSTTSRVKDYLKAYSVSSIPSSRAETRPFKVSRGDNSTRSHYFHNQAPSKVEKSKNAEDLKHRNDLLYEISVAKSDKLEILRDLSTYEYELSNEINLSCKLNSLSEYFSVLPNNCTEYNNLSSDREAISLLIKRGMQSLHALQIAPTTTTLESEHFKVRTYNTLWKMKLLYKSTNFISGVRVLISIKGDTFFENFLVSLINNSDECCMNVAVKLDILAVNTLNQPVEMVSAIETKILPYLYLYYNNQQLQLGFDESLGDERRSLILDLRNWRKTSVILIQNDELIVIIIEELKCEKKVYREVLLEPEQNLSTIPNKELLAKLSLHLRYAKESEEVEWIESVETLFNKKESTSKLMNEEYIKESLGTQAFSHVWERKLIINSTEYTLQCSTYHTLRKLLIKSAEKAFEIKPESQAYKFITGLQSIDISKHPGTLCSSLELKKLIKSYFLYLHLFLVIKWSQIITQKSLLFHSSVLNHYRL